MSSKKWLIMFCICIVLCIGVFALVNYVVDPYGVFGDKFFSWYSFNETYNPRVAKITWLDKNYANYDSYIVGCSSAASYPVDLLNSYYNASFYNLFVYGCDMYDTSHISKYIIDTYNVKNLIVNLGFTECETYMIDKDDGSDALHYKVSGENKYMFYTKYLFKNWSCAFEKIDSYNNDTILPQKFDVFDTRTGMYDKSVRDVENISDKEAYLKNNISFEQYEGYVPDLKHMDDCVNEIKNIKEMCEANGVNVVFVFPPIYYKQFQNYMIEDIKQYYAKIAEVTDFWDFSDTSVSYEERYFYDETHFRNVVGEMMFSRVFNDNEKYYPQQFGRYITKENVSKIEFSNERIDERIYTKSVPVILYHDVSESENGEYVITATNFEEHMKALKENGYNTVSIKQMIDYVYYGKVLPNNPICITFDDGYLSNYNLVYPILKKYDMKANIFVIGASVGSVEKYKDTEYPITPHFSYEQAQEMINSGLITIQSHTYDMHQYAPYENGDIVRENFARIENETDEEYVAVIERDFNIMKKEFNKNLNEEVYALSYPNGKYTVLSEVTLKKLGIQASFSTEQGNNVLINGLPQSLNAMKRINISGETSGKELIKILEKI